MKNYRHQLQRRRLVSTQKNHQKWAVIPVLYCKMIESRDEERLPDEMMESSDEEIYEINNQKLSNNLKRLPNKIV